MMIRSASVAYDSALAEVASAHVSEQFPGHGSAAAAEIAEELQRAGDRLRMLLAAHGTLVTGFIAWHRVYDLHWGKSGAAVADLYVVPERRGLGVSHRPYS
jgi:GNAT superfamily N-acetyltransferase